MSSIQRKQWRPGQTKSRAAPCSCDREWTKCGTTRRKIVANGAGRSEWPGQATSSPKASSRVLPAPLFLVCKSWIAGFWRRATSTWRHARRSIGNTLAQSVQGSVCTGRMRNAMGGMMSQGAASSALKLRLAAGSERRTFMAHYVARQIGSAQVQIAIIKRACCVIGLIKQRANRKGHGKEIERPQPHCETTLERSKPDPHDIFFSTSR